MRPRILIIGSVGQVGASLTPALRARFGADNVIAEGHRTEPDEEFRTAEPFEVVNEVKSRLADLVCDYTPDFPQGIADSWPSSIDNSVARRDWGWAPDHGSTRLTQAMLAELESQAQRKLVEGSKK